MQFDIHKAMMHNKLKRLSPDIKGSWLDIGAGDQPYARYFAKADKYLTTNTKRHYSADDITQLDKLTSFWIEDGKILPVPDNSLDGVACFQVLSVIDKPEEFFSEINRVLKPGGRLIITTDFLYPVWSGEDRSRHTSFNLEELSGMADFVNSTAESFGGFGSTVYALFMRYMRSFPDIWKKKKSFAKLISVIPYFILLLLLPIISLKGIVIFLIEKNNTGNTDFTFNILLTSEKKSV
jgi:ubiquinone/menaquinone biosynthesis C-methylase UbiE